MATKNKQTYTIIKGDVPVLLSAPHAHPHWRPNLEGVYKQGEPWTDDIVSDLCQRAGAYGIVANGQQEKDPNYYPSKMSDYKQALRRLIDKNSIKYVLDIHGLHPDMDYDFVMLYKYLKRKPRDLIDSFCEHVNSGKLRDTAVAVWNLGNKGEVIPYSIGDPGLRRSRKSGGRGRLEGGRGSGRSGRPRMIEKPGQRRVERDKRSSRGNKSMSKRNLTSSDSQRHGQSIAEFCSDNLGVVAVQVEIAFYLRHEELMRKRLIDELAVFLTQKEIWD